MRLFPTDRLPSVRFTALQTALLAHYDFRQSVPRASFVTSRSVIRLIVCVRSWWRHDRRQRAGHLFSRYAPRPDLSRKTAGSPKFPWNPCAQPGGCRTRLAPAPRSTTPVEPFSLTNAASQCCPQFQNTADFDNASISWLNHAARCSLSTLRAVVAFDYARLAYGWWLAFTVPAFTGWVPSEWFHLSSTCDTILLSWASLGAI